MGIIQHHGIINLIIHLGKEKKHTYVFIIEFHDLVQIAASEEETVLITFLPQYVAVSIVPPWSATQTQTEN